MSMSCEGFSSLDRPIRMTMGELPIPLRSLRYFGLFALRITQHGSKCEVMAWAEL